MNSTENDIARMKAGRLSVDFTLSALSKDSECQTVRRFTLRHTDAIEIQAIEGRIPPYVTPRRRLFVRQT
jgi:hypothetical protein